ncbi:MAG: DUF5684 domain-containing protein [Bacillota bacterium]|nr:DUF5684 domain-containing protein [Bacillota bacterium]
MNEELTNMLAAMDPAELAMGSAVLGFIGMFTIVIAIVWFFVSAIGYFKMFKKAGEKAWLAFIPLFRDYIRFKFAWKPLFFWITLGCLIAAQVLPMFDNLVLNLLALAICIVLIVLHAKVAGYIAKAFGKGGGWGALLFFFPFIASLILGFGKAEYIGNQSGLAKKK